MTTFRLYYWLQILFGILMFQYIHNDCFLPEEEFLNGNITFPPLFNEYGNEIMVPELATLKFTCFDGYFMIGPEYLQCVYDNWTSPIPFCAGIRCSDPPKVENAMYENISVKDELTIGAVVKYSCKDGFMLENINASTLNCVFNSTSDIGTWEGELPVCKEKLSCSDPGVSRQGNRSGNCCASGDILNFHCKKGYKLVGSSEIQCFWNGSWTSGRPLCKPVSRRNYCDFPSSIPHGVVTGRKAGDYFTTREEATLLCEPGYKVVGNAVSVCVKGEWTKEFGTCQEIFCDPPELIEHGHILELKASNLTIFPYDFALTYVCDKGYRIRGGNNWRTCTWRGWSGETPRCEARRCPDPGTPENGMIAGSDFSVGATVRFSCFYGYEFLGSLERYCLPNGQWSGEIARCNIESNDCPDPGVPIRGYKNMTVYKKGDKVGFHCQPGHILLGSEVRECLPDGTWSGNETKCMSKDDYEDEKQLSERIKEKVLEHVKHQRNEFQKFEKALRSRFGNGSFPRGRILDLNYPGRIILHFAFDASGSVGKANFDKSIKFAKAIVRRIGIHPNGALAGASIFSSQADVSFFPMTYTTTEEVLAALDGIKYIGGGTAANSALRIIRTQHIPLVKEHVEKGNVKHVIFILTDGKANMAGDPQKEADLLKADKVEIFCIGITGDVNQKTLLKIASTSMYGNKMLPNVFILESYKTLDFLVQEITNGTLDYSQCGTGVEPVGIVRSRIVGGKQSVQPWPWMAMLFMLDEKEDPPQLTFKCSGSIIHTRFILTAAHCMYYEENGVYNIRRKPNEILVKLGLTVVSEEQYLHEFEVLKIEIHDLFNKHDCSACNNLDYDIALLELKDPITYGPFIRPICLPPKVIPRDSKYYSPGEIIYATGWGHTGVVPKLTLQDILEGRIKMHTSPSLKEIALPIQSRKNCLASIKDENPPLPDSYFSPRMFCAGTGKGEQDTCEGDSGGPVMQSFMNADGYRSWTQVGIVSWGLGCGVKNEYGFYTKLNSVMDFVERKIKEDYSRCGIGVESAGIVKSRIVGGRGSEQPWPWMAMLFMLDKKKNQLIFKCGGSIIHPRFILTAAHCMYYEENEIYNNRRKQNEIIVKIGSTILSDDAHLQKFNVLKIEIHDLYIHRNCDDCNKFDYDIALLELERPITYGPIIKPICFPPKVIPKDSKYYTPGEFVYVTGWGHTTVMPKVFTWDLLENRIKLHTSPFLKEIALPIQTREKCLASIKDEIFPLDDSYFSPRVFCAGTGKGEQDTCVGDSGGPVMQYFTNADGYRSWTQVGIVSWGLGCGLKNEYGFYTNLHTVMDFVERKIDEHMKRAS